MIEKLDKHLAGDINSFNMSQNIAVALKAINKINELCDVVNELTSCADQLLRFENKGLITIHCQKCSTKGGDNE